MRIDLLTHSIKGLSNDLLHLRHHVPVNVILFIRVKLVNDVLESRERELIAVFELPESCRVLLDCVVGEVHKRIVDVVLVD